MQKRILPFILVLLSLLLPATAWGAKTFTLVIDAGHGGHDAGAVGKFSKEKNINLNVALEFGRLVERNNPDVKVIYTRKTDVFIPLQERANIANRAKADLFISIHTNSLPAGRIAYGAETYTLGMARAQANLDVAKRENSVILYEKDYRQRYSDFDPNQSESYIIFEFMQDQYMKQSVNLARCIQRSYVKNAGRRDKGVHQAGFLVLRNTSMPSVLTELGFISTPEEEQFLNSEDGIRRMGASIYAGFIAYKNDQENPRTIIQPFKPSKPENNVKKIEDNDKKSTDTPSAKAREDKQDSQPSVSEAQNQQVSKSQEDDKQEAPRQNAKTDGKPVYKVQIFAVNRRLRAGSQQFKGLTDTDYYEENGLVKYTYGESTQYSEILKKRREILDKFPQAFIVAFVDGQRIDLIKARRMSQKK